MSSLALLVMRRLRAAVDNPRPLAPAENAQHADEGFARRKHFLALAGVVVAAVLFELALFAHQLLLQAVQGALDLGAQLVHLDVPLLAGQQPGPSPEFRLGFVDFTEELQGRQMEDLQLPVPGKDNRENPWLRQSRLGRFCRRAAGNRGKDGPLGGSGFQIIGIEVDRSSPRSSG